MKRVKVKSVEEMEREALGQRITRVEKCIARLNSKKQITLEDKEEMKILVDYHNKLMKEYDGDYGNW